MKSDILVEKIRRRDEISPAEIEALEGVLEPSRRIAAGTEFVVEHQLTDHSVLLIEGLSARFSTVEDGGRQITEINVAGDFVDLHSLLMKQMDHGVVALTECVIAFAPHQKLVALTETQPHLTRLLWLDTIIDAAIHRQWLVALGRRNGLGKLAHLLCELFLRLRVVGLASETGFDLPLTQAVLGDALGLSTVHVNRLVMELRASGVLTWQGTRIEILQWDQMVAIAGFDPTYLRLHAAPI